MIYNTSEFKYEFQRLVCKDPQQETWKLETVLSFKCCESLVMNIVPDFPKDDVSLAQETIHSGNFMNCFVYANNCTSIYTESKGLIQLDVNEKKNYLAVSDRSEIITA